MQNISDFYETDAEAYFKQTYHLDPTPFLSVITGWIPPQARVLDVGCGSGRDLLWLRQKGYHAQGLERSPRMADLAAAHSGCTVTVADFQLYDFSQLQFNAIILVGSLVHLTHAELPTVLQHILDGLMADGYMYISLKEGKGKSVKHQGRTFTLWQRTQLAKIFSELGLMTVHFSKNISSRDPRDIWLGYLLRYATS